MAAGEASGPLCGGGDRRVGFEGDEGELSRLGLGVLPPVTAARHPGVWLRVFSSRKLERASYDSVAFRFIAANQHPDHDTIAAFRRRFLQEIEGLFVQVLAVAREMGVLKMGTVALDGTKIHANASRHSALSYEHAGKIEAQLKVADLLAKAEAGRTCPTACRSPTNWRAAR